MKCRAVLLFVCISSINFVSIESVSAESFVVNNGVIRAQDQVYLADGSVVSVADPGSLLEANYVIVGSGSSYDYGNRLLVENGGHVTCLENMYVNGTVSTGVNYDWLYSTASIAGIGSALNVEGRLQLWSYDLPHRTSGTWDPWGVPCSMNISGGAAVAVAGDLSIVSRSSLMINSGGHLMIGSDQVYADGALNIASNGVLKVQLGEHTAGVRLSVDGESNLNGTFGLTLLAGYVPANGDSFDIFDWNGRVNGRFATNNLPELSAGLEWNTSELYTTGRLYVIPEPATAILVVIFGMVLGFVRRFTM